MKVIFLDIDGVLNNTASLVEAVHLLPEKAILLQRLITATDAKIVISSTWRVGRTPAQIQEYLYFIGCWNATVVDFTPALPGVRGHEIQTWLDSGVTNVESYVIIDDLHPITFVFGEQFFHEQLAARIQIALTNKFIQRATIFFISLFCVNLVEVFQ